jgi:hypothetical protein
MIIIIDLILYRFVSRIPTGKNRKLPSLGQVQNAHTECNAAGLWMHVMHGASNICLCDGNRFILICKHQKQGATLPDTHGCKQQTSKYCVFWHHHVFYLKHDVSGTRLCLCTGIGTNCIYWAQLSRLFLEDGDKIQYPKHCVLNKKKRTMDNVQKRNNFVTMPSS